jgi:hypothetical protein
MSLNSEVKVPKDVYEGLKFLERTKSIPYTELRDSKSVVEYAQKLQLVKVAQWIGTHPTEYTVGSYNKSFYTEG